MAAMHFFKTIDSDLGAAWRTALGMGMVVAIVLYLASDLYPVAGGIAHSGSTGS